MMVSLYQRRHPDVAPLPYKVFLAIGFYMMLEVFGMYWRSHRLKYFYLVVMGMYPLFSYVVNMNYYMIGS